jgi:hypothetical protein
MYEVMVNYSLRRISRGGGGDFLEEYHSKFLKQTRRYCKLKEAAVDGTVWRTGFETGYGHVIRKTAA